MTEEQIKKRNLAIKNAMADTLLKRKGQVCRVFTCKLQFNKLSSLQKEQLKMMFVEAKWLYNDILSFSNDGNRPNDYNIGQMVKHYDQFGSEIITSFKYLHSQMKQEVKKKICSSLKGLGALKRNGHKVGKLKFASEYNQLHIKQCNNLKFKNGKRVKIPNLKGLVVVNGCNQFLNIKGIEIACADLLQTPNGYYISFCTFIDKKKIKKQKRNNKILGIDFGCSKSFTTSEGKMYNFKVEESDRLKKLQRSLNKKIGIKRGQKKSNNFKRVQLQIQKEYLKLKNIKNDKANKIVNELLKYGTVIIQDENLTGWKETGHGKKVQHSILGRVKSKLLLKDNVKVINRFAPTTKLCRKCGSLMDLSLSNRIFKCSCCGETEQRDIHAAKNMVWMYKNAVCVGRTKLKHVEIENQISKAIKKLKGSICEA